MGNRDYGNDNTFAGAVTVPAGASLDGILIGLLKNNPTARYLFIIQPSTVANPTTLNLPNLAAAGVVLDGQDFVYNGTRGGLTGWGAGNLTVPTLSGILSITPQASADSVSAAGTTFQGLAITSPAIVGSPFVNVLFWGLKTTDLNFVDCGIFDSQAMWVRKVTSVNFYGLTGVGQTGNVSSLSQSVLTPLSIKTQDWQIKFAGTTGMFGVNAAGADNDNGLAHNPRGDGTVSAPQTGLWAGQLKVTTGASAVVLTPGNITIIPGGTVANGTVVAVGAIAMTKGTTYSFSNVTGVGAGGAFQSAQGSISASDSAYAPDGVTACPATGSLSMSVTVTTGATAVTITGGPEAITLIPAGSGGNGVVYRVAIPVTSGVVYTVTNQSALTYSFIKTVAYGDWRFGYIFDRSSGYEQTMDAEFSQAGSGPAIFIDTLNVRDLEALAIVNVQNYVIGTIRQHVTAARATSCPWIRSFVTNGNLGLTPGFGAVDITKVILTMDDTSANGVSGSQVSVITGSSVLSENPYHGTRFHVGSLYAQVNGNSTTSVPIQFALNTTGTFTANVIEEISIDTLTLSYTSLQAAGHAVISVNCTGDATHAYKFPKVWVGTFRHLGATAPSVAGSDYSATVGGATISVLYSLGIAGQLNTIGYGWGSADFSAVAPTGSYPFIKTTAGTFATSNLQQGSVISTVTTTWGAPTIRGVTFQKSESGGDANVLTVTPPSVAGTYRISIAINIKTAAAFVFGWTATWTDAQGNAQSPTNLVLWQQSVAAGALTFTTSAGANAQDYTSQCIIDTDNSGTNIVVKLTTTSGTLTTGSVTVVIEQLAPLG